MNTPSSTAAVRQRLELRGMVQGIGFRPYVWQMARRHGLSGFVGNHSEGAFVEVEGPPAAVHALVQELRSHPPPLARIQAMETSTLPVRGDTRFVIVESAVVQGASTAVSADLGICDDCLRELRDPANRRFGYPFINCTQCGPRFTITRDLPYDRPRTTMACFPMCAACAAEYRQPADRRFHAQPNACWDCGPTVWLAAPGDRAHVDAPGPVSGHDALRQARQLLDEGAILAIKGLGGFHLACEARNAEAVARLRVRKGRQQKPFALMVDGLETARRLCCLSPAEEALLSSRGRPIVLADKRSSPAQPDLPAQPNPPAPADLPAQPNQQVLRLADAVAPESPHWGILLAYTPLHHLLLHPADSIGVDAFPRDPRVLVMTSGNRREEPIARDNAEALERLAPLADAFLLHNRDIHVVADDSVVRIFGGRELPLRRSRGYAPLPVALPAEGATVLAVGGELKATFCITKGDSAYLSQHLGDVGNLETQQAFARALQHFLTLFRVTPQAVICDAHPGYLSSRWARAYAKEQGLPVYPVQHHRAHVASLLAEHGLAVDTPLLGVALDGTGYGDDGAIWGGEFLRVGTDGMPRVAHLRYLPLPGGDAAIRHPWRCAVSHLRQAGFPLDAVARLLPGHEAELPLLWRQLERNLHCVPTSSAGRLFDAVAAVLGLHHTVDFEAQAAMQLEALCKDLPPQEPYPLEIAVSSTKAPGEQPLLLDPQPLWRAVVADRLAGVGPSLVAARFHASLAQAVLQVARTERCRHGVQRVGLTGGVFQNLRLLRETVDRLQLDEFTVLHHQLAPANDGGLALGQACLGRLLVAAPSVSGPGTGSLGTGPSGTGSSGTGSSVPPEAPPA